VRGTTLAPNLGTPLLVVHDIDDTEVPYAEGARLAEHWPRAQLMTTRGLGHTRILRAPEVVAAASAFVGTQHPVALAGARSPDPIRLPPHPSPGSVLPGPGSETPTTPEPQQSAQRAVI